MIANRFDDDDFTEPPDYIDKQDRVLEPTEQFAAPASVLPLDVQGNYAMGYLIFVLDSLTRLQESENKIVKAHADAAVTLMAVDVYGQLLKMNYHCEKALYERFRDNGAI